MRTKKRRPSRRNSNSLWVVTIVLFILFCACVVWIGMDYFGDEVAPEPGSVQLSDTGEKDTEFKNTEKQTEKKDPDTEEKDTEDTEEIDTEEKGTEDTEEIDTEEKDTDEDTSELPGASVTIIEPKEWNMLLVNPWNPLPEGFEPDLVTVSGGHKADYRVKDALEAMLADCRKAGYSPAICSSYRTISYQQGLFERQTSKYLGYGYDRATAEAEAAKWVARPGTSEHHTGLAFDIVASYYQVLDNTQADTAEQKWLMANCHKYGFILRYPEDKTETTGINYEPWHYRYVGVDIATEIMQKHITLEEYLND